MGKGTLSPRRFKRVPAPERARHLGGFGISTSFCRQCCVSSDMKRSYRSLIRTFAASVIVT
jgi:hypothetical protein